MPAPNSDKTEGALFRSGGRLKSARSKFGQKTEGVLFRRSVGHLKKGWLDFATLQHQEHSLSITYDPSAVNVNPPLQMSSHLHMKRMRGGTLRLDDHEGMALVRAINPSLFQCRRGTLQMMQDAQSRRGTLQMTQDGIPKECPRLEASRDIPGIYRAT